MNKPIGSKHTEQHKTVQYIVSVYFPSAQCATAEFSQLLKRGSYFSCGQKFIMANGYLVLYYNVLTHFLFSPSPVVFIMAQKSTIYTVHIYVTLNQMLRRQQAIPSIVNTEGKATNELKARQDRNE